MEVHKSAGNDIDDLYDRTKLNTITPNEKTKTSLTSLFHRDMQEYAMTTFHLSMLSDDDEHKMTSYG